MGFADSIRDVNKATILKKNFKNWKIFEIVRQFCNGINLVQVNGTIPGTANEDMRVRDCSIGYLCNKRKFIKGKFIARTACM